MSNTVIIIGESPVTEAVAERIHSSSYKALSYIIGETDQDWTDILAAAPETSLAFEWIDTDLARKHAVISALDEALPSDIPLVTSILAISGAEVASWLRNPQRVVGVSLFPPLRQQTVVEVAALPGAEATSKIVHEFFTGLGLTTAAIQDSVGGVLPRIIACLANEAAFAVGEGVASEADIDQAMRLGLSYPRGPLAWAREIGLRRVIAILDGLHREMPDGRYRVAPWLRQQGRLKTDD